MQIYHYHPATLDYMGSSTADKSPLEPDVFLIPAFATTVAPPMFDAATHTCRFVVGAWDVAEITVEPPTPEPTLDDTKAAKLAALAEYRFGIETGGINVSGATIKTDRESQAQLNSALTSLQSGLIPDTPWKADGSVWVTVTLDQIKPIAQAVAAHVRRCFANECTLSEAINALTTAAAVTAYDVAAEWAKL